MPDASSEQPKEQEKEEEEVVMNLEERVWRCPDDGIVEHASGG